MDEHESPTTRASTVAAELAAALNQTDMDYAVGGALALGYWAEPRGTSDVDLTIYVSADNPDACLDFLKDAGGEFRESDARESIREYGFFRILYQGVRVDVFLPTIPVHEACRSRRALVPLRGEEIYVWDAEALAVFKMMFFRVRDLQDVEDMLQMQGDNLDTEWVRQQLVDIFGQRDPRISNWDEIVARTLRKNGTPQ